MRKGRYATTGFFDVFTFPLIVGDHQKLFDDANSIIISDRMALQFFGIDWKSKAIGQLLKVDERVDVAVKGVFKTPGDDSSLQFDWIVPAQGLHRPKPVGEQLV
ncbi:MAG: ABC transporter permease [Bacteroidota bacterium]